MLLIENATIINENNQYKGHILIKDNLIKDIYKGELPEGIKAGCKCLNAEGKIVIPGIIDDQVHFREPGLTHKGCIETESKAAVAGGVTSYMEMPNTVPQTITQSELEKKYEIAARESWANYSFYIGATNTNLEELKKTNSKEVCGIKVFMGSSTGDMLVNDDYALSGIFESTGLLIATHCEDEQTIKANIEKYKVLYGDDVPIREHIYIRCAEACYKSSWKAINLATKYNTRLHVLHVSTAKELELMDNKSALKEKKITSEVCVHHLWFDENDYEKKGTLIKWNPSIKTEKDRIALLEGVLNNRLDVIATDHAPHTLQEKQNSYFKSPSGGPLVQHSLTVMLEHYKKKNITLEKIVEKMCHAPAIAFKVKNRGFIRPGYYADLAIIDLNSPWTVTPDNILYKCKWSPFTDYTFQSKVTHTIINGNIVYENGSFNDIKCGQRLTFER